MMISDTKFCSYVTVNFQMIYNSKLAFLESFKMKKRISSIIWKVLIHGKKGEMKIWQGLPSMLSDHCSYGL
jgi:hypothetical protein